MFQELLKEVDATLPSAIKIATQESSPVVQGATTEETGGDNGIRKHSKDRTEPPTTRRIRQLESLPEVKIPPLSPALSEASNSSVLTTIIKGFTDALEGTNRSSVKPDVFYGVVLKYLGWEVDLADYFKTEKISAHHKLCNLKKYIGGDARKCVESHLSTNTAAFYDEARSILKERYANQFTITRNILKSSVIGPP